MQSSNWSQRRERTPIGEGSVSHWCPSKWAISRSACSHFFYENKRKKKVKDFFSEKVHKQLVVRKHTTTTVKESKHETDNQECQRKLHCLMELRRVRLTFNYIKYKSTIIGINVQLANKTELAYIDWM